MILDFAIQKSLCLKLGMRLRLTMPNLKILEQTFAVVAIYVFVPLIICKKPILTKNGHFCSLENKTEAKKAKTFNTSMYTVIGKFMNAKKMNFNFQSFQQPLISNATKNLFNPTSGCDLIGIQQNHLDYAHQWI